MLTNSIAIRVAMETSEGQVEIELAPEVEIPAWSKKALWPRCLARWPTPESVKCVKVPAAQLPRAQTSQLNHPQRRCLPSRFRKTIGFTSAVVLKVWAPAPAPAAALENLLDMQSPGPHSGPYE